MNINKKKHILFIWIFIDGKPRGKYVSYEKDYNKYDVYITTAAFSSVPPPLQQSLEKTTYFL